MKVAIALLLLLVTACQPAPSIERKLIEWGWDTPRLQQFPSVLSLRADFPFDGAVIDIQTSLDKRGLSWTLFTDQPTDVDALDALARDYGKLNWGRMTDNFLRLTLYPADVDWFDDWTTIDANAQAWAQLAHDLGFKGLVLDTEQYEKVDLFDYQALKADKPFDDYAKKAVERGRDFMDALEAGSPGLTVMLTYALASHNTLGDLSVSHYGLLVPFVEGMALAANDETTMVDGFEDSYIYKNPADFEQAASRIRSIQPRFVEKSGWRAPQVGFGLWIDPVCGSGGLPDAGCGFSRDEFYTAVTAARHNSDRYVWVYSQHINWYTGEGIPGAWSDVMKPQSSS